MKKFKVILLIFFIAMFTFNGFAQTVTKQKMNMQTEFRSLYNNMCEFMINKDILSLEKNIR